MEQKGPNKPIIAGALRKLKYSAPPRLGWAAMLIASIVALPMLVLLTNLIVGDGSAWQHLVDTVLADYLLNSLLLALLVAAGTLAIGVPAAWITSVYHFPGRKLLSWALLLPLALPAYIVAYTYTGLLDFAGPVQTWIRDITGWGYRDYYFPNVRSLPGAAIMLILVLYPYVYLLARAAFIEQSATALDAARSLGASRTRAFWRIALPLARPAIITGLSLALMETLADYGTVAYFGVPTFTTGIFRTWYGLGDRVGAIQLASTLLTFVTLLIWLERYSRRRRRFHQSGLSWQQPPLIQLTGLRAALAILITIIPVIIGFIIPAAVLANWSFARLDQLDADFWLLVWHSFTLAAGAALIAVMLALILAYAQRLSRHKAVNISVGVAGLGYAIPGTIIALGIIIPLAWLDHRVNDLTVAWFDWQPGLIFSGTVFALLFAYTVRFMAVSLNSVSAGLGKIKPTIDDAARSMGVGFRQTLWQVHTPMMRSTVLTAFLVVFVDVLKELPATLILRPFNFDTLAVKAHELAGDERLADAGPAALMIVLVGILPVILLSRSINQGNVRVSNQDQ